MDKPREIGEWIEARLLHVWNAEHGNRHLRDQITIRFRIDHARRAERATDTGAVFYDHALTEMLGRRICKRAHCNVSGTACAVRHDQRDRLFGKTLSNQMMTRQQRAKREHYPEHFHAYSSPVVIVWLRSTLRSTSCRR